MGSFEMLGINVILHYWQLAIYLSLKPSWYVFVIFSCLLNFYRQWHLCKFLILRDVPHFREFIRGPLDAPPPPPPPRQFLYMFMFTHPHAPLSKWTFISWLNLNKYDKVCIFSEIYFTLKNNQKPHVGFRYKGKLITLFSSIY